MARQPTLRHQATNALAFVRAGVQLPPSAYTWFELTLSRSARAPPGHRMNRTGLARSEEVAFATIRLWAGRLTPQNDPARTPSVWVGWIERPTRTAGESRLTAGAAGGAPAE